MNQPPSVSANLDALSPKSDCGFGCTGDDVALHNGWFRCTPTSRVLLAMERRKLANEGT